MIIKVSPDRITEMRMFDLIRNGGEYSIFSDDYFLVSKKEGLLPLVDQTTDLFEDSHPFSSNFGQNGYAAIDTSNKRVLIFANQTRLGLDEKPQTTFDVGPYLGSGIVTAFLDSGYELHQATNISYAYQMAAPTGVDIAKAIESKDNIGELFHEYTGLDPRFAYLLAPLKLDLGSYGVQQYRPLEKLPLELDDIMIDLLRDQW